MHKANSQRILLIEDNPGDARLVREALREAGGDRAQLEHCTSLGDAARLLEHESFDLILLDLGLPDASGLEALAALDRITPRTPVIVLTGQSDDAVALEALRRGAQDHLIKGEVSGDALLRSARYALERQRTVNLRSDLLMGIARQLKTPVDTLLELVQPLVSAADTSLTERQAAMLERVLNTAETLRRFYDCTLDLARNEEGPLQAEIGGLGGAHIIEAIKRRMATNLNAIEGEGAGRAHAFALHALGDDGGADSTDAGGQRLKILMLEDNPGDARLVQENLAEASFPGDVEHSVCLSDTMRRLEGNRYDVVLVDLGLPDASALEAVSEVARVAPRSSLVVLTGRDDDRTALDALKAGAQDYLVKGQVTADTLARSIRFARERQRTVNLRAELLEAIGHELRNPIHVVLGYAHLLLETVPDPLTPEQGQALANVLATTRALRRLSEAMLDLAGTHRNSKRDGLHQADAPAMIDEIKQRMQHLIAVGDDRDAAAMRSLANARSANGAQPGSGRLFSRMFRRLRRQPKQVLLVDPDYDSRTIIRTALESGSFDVVEATREAEVLSHLVSEKIGLAVFERQTPHLGTPQVFDEMRKVAALFQVPLLVLDAPEHANGGRSEAGFRIAKPFTPEQLLFAVDHAMGRA